MDEEDEARGPVRTALAYPFEGETAKSRLLAGTGIHFLAGVVFATILAATAALIDAGILEPIWLVVALFAPLVYLPLVGYGIATSRALLEDEDAPPEWNRWPGLVRDGSWAAGVVGLFALPLVALVALAGTGIVLVEGALGIVLAGLSGVLAALYVLLLAYTLPAAVVSAIHQESAGAAFETETLRETVTDEAYLRTWLAAAALLLGGVAVGGALSVVVVGFAVLFVTQVAAANLFTRGVVEALDITVGEEPPPPPASGYVPGWGEKDRERSRRRRLTGDVDDSLLPTTPGGDDDREGTDESATSAASPPEGTDEQAIKPRTSSGDRGRDRDSVADSARTSGDPGTDIEPAGGADESVLDRRDS